MPVFKVIENYEVLKEAIKTQFSRIHEQWEPKNCTVPKLLTHNSELRDILDYRLCSF